MPFERVAIANRGEPAMRFINAAAELNRSAASPLTTIALYTEPDRHAWFVRDADEAVCIGPATVFDEQLGRRTLSYLDYDVLERRPGLVRGRGRVGRLGLRRRAC